jgi:hypothetical protein
LVIIPVGTTIEVKRLREGSGKITGKLLSISDESFEIRRDIGASVFYEKIAFADVKSVKKGSAEVKWVKDGSGREKTLVGVVSVIVFVAAAAAQICQNGKCF